jgi:ABC-type sugar transport system ATPase subunit
LRSAKTAKTPAAQKKKIQQASNKFNEAYQELSSGNQQKIVSAAGFIDTAIEKLEEMAG